MEARAAAFHAVAVLVDAETFELKATQDSGMISDASMGSPQHLISFSCCFSCCCVSLFTMFLVCESTSTGKSFELNWIWQLDMDAKRFVLKQSGSFEKHCGFHSLPVDCVAQTTRNTSCEVGTAPPHCFHGTFLMLLSVTAKNGEYTAVLSHLVLAPPATS